MQTSHKLTRIFVALFALVMMAAAALAGDPAQNIEVSDQKAGSLLVFPYYTSSSGQTKADTRISISNTGNQYAIVHVFYLQGRDCTQADQFVCLTPNASIVMNASDFDPENTGYILAVSVDYSGLPNQNNGLIGNAFVNDGDYVGNYGAEAFWRHNNARTPLVDTNKDDVAVLDFGGRYDYVPCTLTTEIQSPKDAPGQRVVTAGLFGDISGLDPLRIGSIRGAGQVGIGQAYNAQEKFASFSRWLNGACQADARITETSPRVPSGLGSLIGAGNAGTIKFNVGVVVGSPIFGVPSGDVIGGAVGLLMTPKTNAWKGIRTLHKTKQTISFVTIPVFMPYC